MVPSGMMFDELADLLAREPETQVEADGEGLQITSRHTLTRVEAASVDGIGDDIGERFDSVVVRTELRGNLAMPSSPRIRSHRLNVASAVGAIQAPRPGASREMVIGSRICVDREVPWHPTGRDLVRLAVTEAGATRVDETRAVARHLERAGIGVWRNGVQSIAGVEPDRWRVVRRAPDALTAQPLGGPELRGVTVSLTVGSRSPAGRGLHYTLRLPRTFTDADELAAVCDALNTQEMLAATGSPHIGSWSATEEGGCRYQISVPARLGRRLQDLPRQLLEGSGGRATAAMQLSWGDTL